MPFATDPKRAVEDAWQCVPASVKRKVLQAMKDYGHGLDTSAEFVEAAFDALCPIKIEGFERE
jgi:hypothetical protein